MPPDELLPSVLRDSLAQVYAHLADAIRELPPRDFRRIEPELRDCAHRMAELIDGARRNPRISN